MKKSIFLYFFLIISIENFAQQSFDRVTIEPEKDEIMLGQPMEINVTLYNTSERPSVQFPELKDFTKGSMSTTTKTLTEEGNRVMIQIISQQYFTTHAGLHTILPFHVTVNKNRFRSEGFNIDVKENAKDSIPEPKSDEAIFSAEIGKDDAFLSIKTNKSSVYVGEGFNLRLSLFIAKNAPLDMEFYRLDSQLELILKSLRSPTCWEENLGISEIIPRDVLVNGRKFTEYLIYHAVFFPITPQRITVPPVHLQMLVHPPDQDQQQTKNTFRNFTSRLLHIQVTPLPDHPMKDQVAVGTFQLQENVGKKSLASGESFRYRFRITGQGNISAILPPAVPKNSSFDFYQPEMEQTIRRDFAGVAGEKNFDYFIVAKQKGVYPWGNFFQWIYFDPRKKTYDTLRSAEVINVSGESLKESRDDGSADRPTLFSNIDQLDTSQFLVGYQSLAKNTILVIIAFMLAAMIWIFKN